VTRVVLTREKDRNDSLRAYLPLGVEVIEVPATRTEFRDPGAFEEALRELTLGAPAPWLVVTSARGARYAQLAQEILGAHGRVASVGMATTRELRSLGVAVAISGDADAAALASYLDGTVVTIGALETRGELEARLNERGVAVHQVACYETRACELSTIQQRTLGDADVVFVGAPSAWRVIRAFVNDRALLVVPGATTAHDVGTQYEVMVGWDDTLPTRLRAWVSTRERAFGEG